MAWIVRENNLDELIGLTGTSDIKVINGVQPRGKSVLLQRIPIAS